MVMAYAKADWEKNLENSARSSIDFAINTESAL